ncbi:MAG: GHKL domain-containing protein [Sedimentibacter sp.]
MINEKNREWLFILGFVLLVIIGNLPVIYTYFYHNITDAPEAVNGRIDLLYTNNVDKKIYLDGQWEFYWEKFIVSDNEQNTKPDLIMDVPDEWSHYKINEENLPAEGFGSYKLILSGIEYNSDIALYLPDYGGAYRVFIDGHLASESGIVSKDIDSVVTVPKTNLYPVRLSYGSTHEVIIEVATTRFSGLYMTPILSNYEKTISENIFRNAIRFILFGIALFSFFTIIAIYLLFIKQKLHFFWIPVMIFFILIRIMVTSEFYSFWQPIFFFNTSYESTNELMYFTTFVLKYLQIFLVQEQCEITFANREKIGFLIYYILLYFIYLLIPQNIYNNYLSVYLPMFSYVLEIYLFIKIYQERNKLKKFGIIVFCCGILVVTGLAVDSYYINGKIYMNMSMTMLFLFTLSAIIMICVYVLRSKELYHDFMESSSGLDLAKGQIAMQKEYYSTLSTQINEIREIKHDIHHFTVVMGRLVDNGELEKLEIFLNEYNKKTKMEQLPYFCENTIANSIIGYYYLRAKEFEILFESRCNIDMQFGMSDSDICIVLGNALENAICACRQMDNSKIRFVSAEALKMSGQRLIKVKNSYNGKLIIKDGRYVSSKEGNSHGLGIRNIEKVVDSYGGYVKVEHDEKEFTIMVATPVN